MYMTPTFHKTMPCNEQLLPLWLPDMQGGRGSGGEGRSGEVYPSAVPTWGHFNVPIMSLFQSLCYSLHRESDYCSRYIHIRGCLQFKTLRSAGNRGKNWNSNIKDGTYTNDICILCI